MITRLFSAACGFAGGLFAGAALADGANGWLGPHVCTALALTAVAAVLAATG